MNRSRDPRTVVVLRHATVLAAILVLPVVTGCGWVRRTFHLATTEPVFVADLAHKSVGAHRSRLHPRYATPDAPYVPGGPTPPAIAPADKIAPELHRYLNDPLHLNVDLDLLVTFREGPNVVSLESLGVYRSRHDTSSAVSALRKRVVAMRQTDQAVLASRLHNSLGATVAPFGSAWLVRGANVRISSRRLLSLAGWADVEYIEPRYSNGPLPGDTQCPGPGQAADECDDPFEARRSIGTDAYLDAHLKGMRIALLDTGVRSSHVMFSDPSPFIEIGSLVNPDNEWDGSPGSGDDVMDNGHGTADAALLCGGRVSGERYHGYTQAELEAIRIFWKNTQGGLSLDRLAGVAAMERAVDKQARVILVESQEVAGPRSMLSEAADKAVGNGVLVVAPTGNVEPDEVGSPATARGILSIGGFSVQSGDYYALTRYEADPDLQRKPDVISPTEIETAANTGDSDLDSFGGTSAAGPGGAAAASLLWSLLAAGGVEVGPGYVMAGLIACADPDRVSADARKRGAGCVRLPQQGYLWFGYVDLERDSPEDARDVVLSPTRGGDQAVPATPPGGSVTPQELDVAIWWPEGLAADPFGSSQVAHNEVSMTVYGPSSHQTAADPSAVWQRLRMHLDDADAPWRIHIAGRHVVAAHQRVYWFAWAH